MGRHYSRFARQQIDVVQRTYDKALVHKDKLKKEHGVLFLHTARTFESKCRIAGENELADRVRPSEKRPGLTLRDADEFPDEVDSPSAGDSSQVTDSDPVAISDASA